MQRAEPDDKLWYASHHPDRLMPLPAGKPRRRNIRATKRGWGAFSWISAVPACENHGSGQSSGMTTPRSQPLRDAHKIVRGCGKVNIQPTRAVPR
jgi:hypothetical protein